MAAAWDEIVKERDCVARNHRKVQEERQQLDKDRTEFSKASAELARQEMAVCEQRQINRLEKRSIRNEREMMDKERQQLYALRAMRYDEALIASHPSATWGGLSTDGGDESDGGDELGDEDELDDEDEDSTVTPGPNSRPSSRDATMERSTEPTNEASVHDAEAE